MRERKQCVPFLLLTLTLLGCLGKEESVGEASLDIHLRALMNQAQRSESGDLTENKIDLMIEGNVDRAALEAIGVEVNTQVAEITTTRAPIGMISAITKAPGLRYLSAASPLQLMSDVSVPETRATPDYWTQSGGIFSGKTGKNVILGIVDTGLDFNHQDFRKTTGCPIGMSTCTRVKYLWDQTRLGTKPPGFNYGAEWTEAQINAGSPNETDDNGHGSHIAGIAAGNGRATGNGVPAYRYIGVAPEADLVVVKSKLYYPSGGGLAESDVLDGVNYIFQKATLLGKSAVVLLAVGNQVGAHDGTSSFDQGLSALTGPGKIIVISAGNYGGQAIHSRVDLASGSLATISFTVPNYTASPNPEYVDIEAWYGATASFSAKLTSPTGITSGWVAPGIQFENLTSTDGAFRVQNGILVNSKGAKQIRIFLWDSDPTFAPKPGTWTLEVQRQSGATSGILDAWVAGWLMGSAGISVAFTSLVDTTRLVANGATADSVISVGAYSTKVSWTNISGSTSTFPDHPNLYELAALSAAGPRRDGIQRPDLTAPGQGVAAALSANATAVASTRIVPDGVHWINRGTSASAAHVAGVVAILLQQCPGLTTEQVRSVLRASAINDSFTGTVPNGAWGYGKLRVPANMTCPLPQPKQPPEEIAP